MKFLIVAIMFIAGGVFAAIPDSASGWYTPDNYSFEGVDATWEDSKGNKWGASVDRQGNVIWSGIPGDPDLKNALEYALSAYAVSKFNQDEIETLGENLHKVFSTDGITVTGKTPDGSTQSYTIKFTSGIGESGTIQGETDHMKWNLADEKSLEMLKGNKIQIKGWKDADGSSSIFEENNLGLVARMPGNDLIYRAWHGVDKLSLAPSSSSKKLQLNQWDTAPDNGMLPLSEALVKERKDIWSNYKLVVRNSSKGLNYVDVGTLPIGGGSPVDGTSITTNTSAGASVQGEASLYGWSTADDMGLPYKSNGKLAWKAADEWVDGASLAFADVDGEKKFEVNNAHMYAGKHSKHYFGTGSDKSAPLGWHELPNTSTNRVEGDERTISSNPNIPGKNPDPEVKTLGLIGWNYTYSGQDPLFMVNRGGALDYMPLPAITNLAACACTNKWQSLLGWVDDGELSEDGEDGIKFEYSTLDEYLYNGLGYIYSTTPDNLHFNNDGDKIQASFTAPENWADGLSLNLTDDGKYQIRDFEKAGACGASVSKMLSDPKGSDATTHLLLAKKTDDGSLHYVPFGEGIAGGGEHADGVTIVTNTAAGAVEQGLLSLYGFASAKDGKVLTKKDGKVAWEDGGIPADEITLAATEDKDGNKKLGIKGFEDAEKNSIPWKNENGEFVWGGASTVTNRILAGAGINITDNGGGAITISAQKLMEDSAGAASEKVLTVITDMRYDAETHKFQCKRRQIRFTGSFVGDDPEWEDVFEATSHKEEHSSGN